jgi:mRNA interferase RelE/StbE
MAYQLVYTARAVRDIRKLDDSVTRRLKLALERYAETPFQFAQRLTESQLGTYRFRVGDYRVIVDVEDDKGIILRVGHRRDIYRGV